MFDILKESQKVELYLDNDATGETYTNGFIKVAKLYQYYLQNGLATDWDLTALRGRKDKLAQVIVNLKIEESKVEEIWKMQVDIFDQRAVYSHYEDLNAFLIGIIAR